MGQEFSYKSTLKTKTDKEFLNFQVYLLYSAKTITKWFYHTSITPHQIILVSLIFGIVSSFLIIQDSKLLVLIGAVMLYYKNALDKVDGSLARAKNLATRRGRFYDSLSDFIVSLCLFIAIAWNLFRIYDNYFVFVVCFIALISSMLQCSFFVYYEISYIKYSGKNTINRLIESVTEQDLKEEDRLTILLQRIFQIIYGWQDRMFSALDKYCYTKLRDNAINSGGHIERIDGLWYYHKTFLAISSILAIGSHMIFIALFTLLGSLEYYLVLNLILFNLLLIFAIIYHYISVRYKLKLKM
jgi:phosphatidylglycerophosphate synthase